MLKKGLMEEYINKVINIKNQLLSKEKPVHDKSIYQLLLNSLLQKFLRCISNLKHYRYYLHI